MSYTGGPRSHCPSHPRVPGPSGYPGQVPCVPHWRAIIPLSFRGESRDSGTKDSGIVALSLWDTQDLSRMSRDSGMGRTVGQWDCGPTLWDIRQLSGMSRRSHDYVMGQTVRCGTLSPMQHRSLWTFQNLSCKIGPVGFLGIVTANLDMCEPAHVQKGYSTCFVCLSVCVSACLSVNTLLAVASISLIKLRYDQLQFFILFIFNSWIQKDLLRSQVMASLAYRERLWQYCSDPCFVFFPTVESSELYNG